MNESLEHSSEFQKLFEEIRADKSQVKPFGFFNKEPIDVSSLDLSLALEEFTQDTNDGLLWKIEKNGIKPSYVLGTLHANDEEIKEILDELKPIIEEVDAILTEADKEEVIKNILAYIQLPKYQDHQLSLNDLTYDSELIKNITTCFKKVYSGINFFIVSTGMLEYHPWYITTLLNNGYANGDNSAPELDLQIATIAKNLNKTVGFLETTEGVLELTGCHWPIAEQIARLNHSVKNYEADISTTKAAKEYYLKRQLFPIFQLHLDFLKSAIANKDQIALVLQKKLINDRNLAMVTNMLPFLEKGNALTAVGAIHLFGKHGILTLLHQQGFKISCAKVLQKKNDDLETVVVHESIDRDMFSFKL